MKKHRASILVAGIVSLGLVAACGSASLVRRDQQGGTLALEGNLDKAREDAAAQMAAHCNGRYEIVREERVVVGQTTEHAAASEHQSEGDRSGEQGAAYEQGVATTKEIYERQISYRCLP